MMHLRLSRLQPLEQQEVHVPGAHRIQVFDAEGVCYHQNQGDRGTWLISGMAGHHVVCAYDQQGNEIDRDSFLVFTESSIQESDGRFSRLFASIHHTLEIAYAEARLRSFDGERTIRKQCITSRGTWTGGLGGRYFFDHMRDSTDFFAAHPRHDGMIWDFGFPVDPHMPYHFEWRWNKDFHTRSENKSEIFARQPIMNDVEHQFINGLYLAWQTTGDDA